MRNTSALLAMHAIFVVGVALLPCLTSNARAQEDWPERFVSLEDDIRSTINGLQDSAKQVGLESFIQADAERLNQGLRDSRSLTAAARQDALNHLLRQAEHLAGTIYFRPQQPNWGPEQATGAPDAVGEGENATSWTPATEDAGEEWLKLTYAQPTDIAQVRVHQNFNPGVITRVTVGTDGGEIVIWTRDPEIDEAPKCLTVTTTTAVRARTITLHLDTKLKPGWNEIDAVRLVGVDGSQQWANGAEASSVFRGFGRGPILNLRGSEVTNAWLAACALKIPDVEQVHLYDTSITDVGLAHLRNLEQLGSLVLRSPEITGSGLKDVSAVKLRNLNFIDSGVTNEGLESIAMFRELEAISLDRTRVTGDGLRRLAGMDNLRSLSLEGLAISDEDLAHLPALPTLENLRLTSTGITTLDRLRELKSLKSINLDGTQVNDVGLTKLAEFPERIEAVSLIGTKVTGAGLRHLAGMKSLSFLNLQGTKVTNEGLSHLSDLASLQYLNLSSTKVTSVTKLGTQLESLNTLDLRETQLADAGITNLGSFSQLENLHLSKTKLMGPGLASLKEAKHLARLDLNGTRVNDAALAPLIELPTLTRLELSSTRITDATLRRIAATPRLTYLDIFGTNTTADGIRHLATVIGLRELYAGGTAADDAAIAALAGLNQMVHLDLQGTRVSDEALISIGGFEQLNSLVLADTNVTGSTISELANIKDLRKLNLGGTRISNEALQTITQTFSQEVGETRGFSRLNNLILTDTAISDAGLRHLPRLERLNSLHIAGTNVGDDGMAYIGRLPALRSLWLDRTSVSHQGLAALSNADRLRELSLNRTKVGDEVVAQLGESIQQLGLSHTRVSDVGVRKLSSKKDLEVLELAGTEVTDSALEAVARLPKLRKLDLGATTISDRGVATLASIPNLSDLQLDQTAITDLAAESLAEFDALAKVSLNETRVTADGKSLMARRHPGLAVELDFPWVDAWTDEESRAGLIWSTGVLPEDATISDLAQLASVRALSFRHREIDAETLRALGDFEYLESLDLADTSIDDRLLSQLSKLPRLRALRLSRTAVTDDGLRHLTRLPRLEQLDLDGTQITGAGLHHLEVLTSLRSIHLRDTLLRDEYAAQLAGIDSLRKISATNTRLGDAGMREIKRLPALRYLDLYGTHVTDEGLSAIGGMSSLSHLYVSATAVSDEGLAKLVGLEELVELGLKHCEITDTGMQHLAHFTHLEKLLVSGTRVSDAGAATISKINSLRHIELADTTLSDRGLEELATLPSLERLSVIDTDVSLSSIESFRGRFPTIALTYASVPSEFSWAGTALSTLYGFIVLAICVYGAHRYLLVWLFLRNRDVRRAQHAKETFAELPNVTIQIPLFNERNVAERIIAACCSMDYPRDRLQIQVLDDSTDNCTQIVRRCCERFRKSGVNIVCHHRETRDGFKSGALAAGLKTATGELVAIFDADFTPSPDFLNRTVHHFTDDRVGVVQAEWRHLNRHESTLTECQAMFLDGHFIVEQATRARTGRWFNFNGTAGVWRRSCIDEAGGWRADTLTEDTDLSYRAQLSGWRFVYLPDVHVDAELPATMSAFLSQQHRWSRGLLQCAMKLMPQILRSEVPLRVKTEAWFHLTAPILYAVMFLLTALAIPATFVTLPTLPGPSAWALGGAVLICGTIGASIFYLLAQRAAGQSVWRTLIKLPALMALGIGISAVNTRAVIGALLGVRSPFVRTPKFGGRADSEADPEANRTTQLIPVGSLELIVSGLLLASMFLSFGSSFALIGAPFLLLFAAGFLWVGGTRFVERGHPAYSSPRRSSLPRWSMAGTIVAATAVILIGFFLPSWRNNSAPTLANRIVGFDLTQSLWSGRGSTVASTNAQLGGLTLDVDLNPKSDAGEEGEISIELTGPLKPIGTALLESQQLVFDVSYPPDFSGELQAFVSDADGQRQYGSIAFVERHDALRSARVGIAPSALTPAMGYSDPDFTARRPIHRIGLKVSAQSDRVRGRDYRSFLGELTITGARVVPRDVSAPPDIRALNGGSIQPSHPTSPEEFLASSGADRPWPLGYAFSGPLSAQQRQTLDQTYAALHQQGLGFTRVYIGDYRTGLIFDQSGSVLGIEPQFLEYLDELVELANHHGVTVMLSLMDNTLLDGKGVEYPQFILDGSESDHFVGCVLAPIVKKLAKRQVIWDLFNEPENVTGASLSEVQNFVDRALMVLRSADTDAKFTVVSRNASELVYWRGRGLDVLSHNIFDQRGLDAARSLATNMELDAPIWVAEMAPELATSQSLEDLRNAGYSGVGLWGWETGDKYDWGADQLQSVVCSLVAATTGSALTGDSGGESICSTRELSCR